MNKTLLLLTILAVGALASTAPAVEEGVYVLTDSNFNEFIASKPFVLVEFYAPWCGHCKKLAPEYAKAAQALASENSQAVLAKVDATEQKDLGTRFSIQGFPTLKFFINGSTENPVDFNGGRTEKDILNWIKKRTGSVSEALNTAEELTAFTQKNQVAIVYFGESEKDANYEAFKSLAMSYDDLAFAHVFNADLRTAQNAAAHNLVLYKHFDEKRNDFTGTFNVANLKTFVDTNSFPIVMPFNDRAIQKVFQQGNPTLFLFSNSNEASLAAEKAFAASAEENRGKIVFSISKPDDTFGHYQKLADYIGVNTAQVPALMLVHSSHEVLKYKFTASEITHATINQFVSDYLAGKLSTYLKSEDIPATNDEPVKVLVGKSFDDLVINSNKDVLVEFYAPWCGHCKQLAPIYDAVAKKLSHNHNIVIAKIDSTANEVPGVNIRGFPTIKFYQNGKKSTPLDFEGDRTEEGILKYLKEKTTFPWVEKNEDL
ncbi:protein disulfide-isomerase (macronuclear) [Tetrahymena thermophila SB210]|uniref:Protein disulfide-isomerase n=1 Tax=Tetrahymena thermophila (strain SB210) TaxID=312017 RepID=I7MHY7_TETTS|nr:protein disulfide-isomerase [Tetrahymena thermophila SB210]EAS03751.2 protein disulfide-isomerase [Tetrahymena thermophila SB210]|eukprot:XP_001023996.2 protein disulfide-isomerase [Tetrahymena thermophila SB210]